MDGCVLNFPEKAVDDRSFPDYLPSRTGGLAEDDVSDLIMTAEFQKFVGNIVSKGTYYNQKLNELDAIKAALTKNRLTIKAGLRKKW